MVKEAIVSLKEKTDSSQHAIAKFVEEKHKNLPFCWFSLGSLFVSDKLVKVKTSYKLPAKSSAPKPAKKSAASKSKAKPAAKPKPVGKTKPTAKAKPASITEN